MRTTVTLAPDVSEAVERLRRERGAGLSETVNDLLRRGLLHGDERAHFVQRTSDLGRPRLELDDVSGVLDLLEGADRRS